MSERPNLTAPPADWLTSWAELTGYVTQARDDGEQIDPAELLRYLAELKHRALAPIRDWLNPGAAPSGEPDTEETK